MNRNHDAVLQNHITEAFDRGWTVIPWWSLHRWFGMERLSKSVWRDILARWREIVESSGGLRTSDDLLRYNLYSFDSDEGVLLVRDDGKEKKRRLIPVTERADDQLSQLI